MKGRTVWNKPSIRKTDVYKLIIKLGGKARWTHLKAHLKELGWGPTTLKQTLDELVNEGSIMKEAVAGDKGPEIWYGLPKRNSGIWELFPEIAEKSSRVPSFEEIKKMLEEKAEGLGKGERDEFLRNTLRELVETAAEIYTVIFCLGADELVCRRPGAVTYIDASFDLVKEATLEIMHLFLEYPEAGAGAVVDALNDIAAKHSGGKTIRDFSD
mgnify:CR=1 FL=1